MSKQKYDRMNPELDVLIEKLKAYYAIDYTTEAWPLSRAEAELIVKYKQHYDTMTDAGRALHAKLAADLALAVEALERLTKIGPPSEPTSGAEWASQCLMDNCAIAFTALEQIKKHTKKDDEYVNLKPEHIVCCGVNFCKICGKKMGDE